MKKLLWVIVVIATTLFATLNAKAQSIQSVVKELSNSQSFPYTQKIVALNNDTTIAFSRSINSNNYVFYLTPTSAGGTSTDVAELVDPNLIVKDVKTLNNSMMFFCGEFNGVGFIAYTSIPYFFSVGTNAFQYILIQNSVSIDKIDAFIAQGLHIVGVGTDVNGLSFFLHSDMNNNELYYGININPTETFDDLAIDGQYVITVGRNNNSPTATDIIIRRYDFSTTPVNISEIAFNFAQSNILHKLHSVTIYNDYLAVVGTTDYNGASTLAMIVDVLTFGIIKAEYFDGYQDQSIEVRDLTYYSQMNQLIILERSVSATSPIPMDAAIVWDVVANPAPSVDIYYGLPNNVSLLLNGITEYDAFDFAAIGIDPNTQLVNIWYGDRSISGKFNCNQYANEVLITAPVSKTNVLSVIQLISPVNRLNDYAQSSVEGVSINCK